MKNVVIKLVSLLLVSVFIVSCANNEVSINKELFKNKYSKEKVASTNQFFIYQDTKLKDKNGNIADIYVGVPVKILNEKDGNIEVKIEGYLSNNELYSTSTKDIIIAKVSNNFNVVKKDGDLVEVVGTLSKELVSNDLPDIWGEQEEFYYEMCTQCHAGPEINTHSMVEWSAIFGTMRSFAKLDDEESGYLLRFLMANSYDGLVKIEK